MVCSIPCHRGIGSRLLRLSTIGLVGLLPTSRRYERARYTWCIEWRVISAGRGVLRCHTALSGRRLGRVLLTSHWLHTSVIRGLDLINRPISSTGQLSDRFLLSSEVSGHEDCLVRVRFWCCSWKKVFVSWNLSMLRVDEIWLGFVLKNKYLNIETKFFFFKSLIISIIYFVLKLYCRNLHNSGNSSSF